MSDFARDTDVLISRQAAYEMLTEYYHHRTDLQHKALKEALERVPSAQERKKGKWVEEVGMLMCSECGDAWGTEQFDEVMSFNYCPNCGAEMVDKDINVHSKGEDNDEKRS